MSVEIACTCGGLPSHSHAYVTVHGPGNRLDRAMDPYDVRIWIDWKEVARAFAVPGPSLGTAPTACLGCGKVWRGLDEHGHALCCGASRDALLRRAEARDSGIEVHLAAASEPPPRIIPVPVNDPRFPPRSGWGR